MRYIIRRRQQNYAPQICIVCSDESEKHKLEINASKKYRYQGGQNIFHLNCRGISGQKTRNSNWDYFHAIGGITKDNLQVSFSVMINERFGCLIE